MMDILVHGIRNTTHSVALVNQFQLLGFNELKERCHIFHADCQHQWETINAGFDDVDTQAIAGIAPPVPGQRFDVIYFINETQVYNQADKQFLFYVTEFGNMADNFVDYLKEHLNAGTRLITPSNWSKKRLMERLGSNADISVIPHGVNNKYFRSIPATTISQIRNQLNLGQEHFVFLNVGAMTWNKGIDLLLKAFQVLSTQHENIRLILKDSNNIYQFTATSIINQLCEQGELTRSTLDKIVIFSGHINLDELANLYNIADCYIAPYRAEGFNLPVLEALACHTPVIITKGGPTDDYVSEGTGIGIESSLTHYTKTRGLGLEPSFDSIVTSMRSAIENKIKNNPKFHEQADLISSEYAYRSIAGKLIDLFTTNGRN